jgi:dTDP-4-dehydrorhamnose reductase
MLRLGRIHDKLRVVADQSGGPTWAGDIAATLLTIVKRYESGKSIPWGTYHYCGTPGVSWYDFAQAIFTEAVNLSMLTRKPQVIPITTAEYPTPAKRPMNSVLHCEKIKQQLRINQPDWHTGLKNTLQAWQKQ